MAQRLGGSPAARAFALLVALAVAALSAWRLAVTLDHARLLVYQLPAVAVIAEVAAAGVAVLAAGALVVLPRPLVGLAAAVTTVLCLLGLLVFPPAGLLAGLIGALAIRLLAGPAGLVRPSVAGALLAAGVLVVWVVSSQPPVVRCLQGGVSSSDRAWWGGSSGGGDSGSGSVSPGGVAAGSISAGGRTFAYACQDGRLLRFAPSAGPAVFH